jgi:LacI family transcriptional regulator
MRDVAALAGVGVATVSRVIRDESTVSEALRAKVLRAAAQLDYLPNLTASSLRRGTRQTSTICLLLENVANPFSSALHRAIGDVAAAHGFDVFSGSVDEHAEAEHRLAAKFAARRVDGLILVPASHDHSYLATQRHVGMAMVFVDRPAELLDADAVLADNWGGMATATRHLLSFGHRRIGYIGDLRSIWTAQQRFMGYWQTLEGAGLSCDPSLVRHDVRGVDAAEAATVELMAAPDPPTAILGAQNLLTIGAIRVLRRLGLHHRIAIVGFDDFLLADLVEPAITVVAQDPRQMGTLAAEILFARLDGDASPTSRHEVETRFLPRGSGEIRPD